MLVKGAPPSDKASALPRAPMTEPFDVRAFRRALGHFATGVAVVTARGSSGPVGVTISSFNSVSADPPLVLFSIDRRALSLSVFESAEEFAINVLSVDQRAVSDRFSRPGADKWSGIACRSGAGGAPLLSGALAHLECAPWAQHDGGDHLIFVVRVQRFACREGRPLIFFMGAYRDLTGEEHPAAWPLPMHY